VTLPDLINGLFESGSGLFQTANCFRLYRDKMVLGIAPTSMAFFTAWGFWNLYYYPNLDQWFSFAGGIVIVSANLTWVSMAFYYGRPDPPTYGGRPT
jgi:hypothetical protein